MKYTEAYIKQLQKVFEPLELTFEEKEAILKYELDKLIKLKDTKYKGQCNFELANLSTKKLQKWKQT